MALTPALKDALAEKGALLHLQDLKEQIAEIYKAFPGLLKAEQNEKRKQTMLAKYGTLNPHQAKTDQKAEAAASAAGTGTATTAAPKAKVSHKKGQGKKAAQGAQGTATSAAVDAATASAIGAQTGTQAAPATGPVAVPAQATQAEEVMEVTEDATAPAGVGV